MISRDLDPYGNWGRDERLANWEAAAVSNRCSAANIVMRNLFMHNKGG